MSTTIKTVTIKFNIPKMEQKVKKIKTEQQLFRYAKHLKNFIDLGFVKSSPALNHMFNSQLEKIYNKN